MTKRTPVFRPKERYLVPAHGPTPPALEIAIAALKLLCEKHDSDALIVVPALKYAAGTALNDVIPEKQLDRMVKGEALKLSDKHKISMCSRATFKNHHNAKVVFAPFASQDTIEMIESSYGCTALVVVPWIPEDITTWSQIEGVVVLSTEAHG